MAVSEPRVGQRLRRRQADEELDELLAGELGRAEEAADAFAQPVAERGVEVRYGGSRFRL